MTSVALSSNIIKNFRALSRQISSAASFRSAGLTVRTHLTPRRNRVPVLCSTQHFSQHRSLYQVSQIANRRNDSRQRQSNFTAVIRRLDDTLRRFGVVRKNELMTVMNEVVKTGTASPNQALLIIRSCGSLLSTEQPEQRTALVHQFWKQFEELGTIFDSNHYNTLLKVYLQNDHHFSASDFLDQMEARNVQPNRVTYQRLITAYCKRGEIGKATEVLELMKNKELPVTEGVFNSLIMGHARAGEMDKAESILDIMRKVGLNPTVDSYTALMVAHAETGNMDKIKEINQAATDAVGALPGSNYLEVVYALGMNDHTQHIREVLENTNLVRCISESINVSTTLLTRGKLDAAYEIVRKMKPNFQTEGDKHETGFFFLREMAVQDSFPTDKVASICKAMKEEDLITEPMSIIIQLAMKSNTSLERILEYFSEGKEMGMEIRPHYFWPLFLKGTSSEVDQILKKMVELEVKPNEETYKKYVLPKLNVPMEELQTKYKEYGLEMDDELMRIMFQQQIAQDNMENIYSELEQHKDVLAVDFPYRSFVKKFFRELQVEPFVNAVKLVASESENSKDEVGSVVFFLMREVAEKNLTQNALQAAKKALKKMKEDGLSLSIQDYRTVLRFRDDEQVKKLLIDVFRLVSKQEVEPTDFVHFSYDAMQDFSVDELNEYYQILMDQGKTPFKLQRLLFISHCTAGNLEKALEAKQLYEDAGLSVNAFMYSHLLQLYIDLGRIEDALNIRDTLKNMYPNFRINNEKYALLVSLMVKNGQKDEARKMLDEEELPLSLLFKTMADEGLNKELIDLYEELKTVEKPPAEILRHVVMAYCNIDDFDGAWQFMQEANEQYNNLPGVHDYLTRLVMKKDAAYIQKVLGLLTEVHGDTNTLHNLCFAFLSAGKTDEARKVVDTPGFMASDQRLEWFARMCVREWDSLEPLEALIDVTQNFYGCDRERLYFYLVMYHARHSDAEKALAVLSKMQDEDVIPSDTTLRYLANFLQDKGINVPFVVPEIPQNAQPEEIMATPNQQEVNVHSEEQEFLHSIWVQVRAGELEQALKLKESYASRFPDMRIGQRLYSRLIRDLAAKGDLQNAKKCFDESMEFGYTLEGSSLRNLCNLIATDGNLEALEEIEEQYKTKTGLDLPAKGAFLKCHYYRSGLDAAFQYADTEIQMGQQNILGLMTFFRILLENGEPWERVKDFTLKYADQSIIEPLKLLKFELINRGDIDRVKELLKDSPKTNAVILNLAYIVTEKSSENSIDLIEHLLDITRDEPQVDQEFLYNRLLKTCNATGDFEKGLQVKEQMDAKGVPLKTHSQKLLADLLRRHKQEVPFDIPMENITDLEDKYLSQFDEFSFLTRAR